MITSVTHPLEAHEEIESHVQSDPRTLAVLRVGRSTWFLEGGVEQLDNLIGALVSVRAELLTAIDAVVEGEAVAVTRPEIVEYACWAGDWSQLNTKSGSALTEFLAMSAVLSIAAAGIYLTFCY